jgi:hypothetical protein
VKQLSVVGCQFESDCFGEFTQVSGVSQFSRLER